MNTGCGCGCGKGNGISGAAFALVLFILLVNIKGAFIKYKEVNCMFCGNPCNQGCNIFFIILILFILLAIIFGSCGNW